ncbi:MAG: DNA repair protein RecO C-terminal domain-containing protein, partial [Deltaproteobacteria bacterium]
GGHQNPELFEVLLCFLKLVNFSGGSKSLLRFYEIKLLTTLGYMPHLSGCVVCRGNFSGGRVFFNSEKGGAVCGVCAGYPRGTHAKHGSAWVGLGGLIPFSAATASLLGMAGRMPAEKLSRLVTDEAFTKESEAVLSDFIRHQTGRELKTKKIIERLGM